MDIPDLINSGFMGAATFMILLTVWQLVKDKQVHGVHWGTVLFFISWGVWGIYYYGHLDQIFSLVVGISTTVVNAARLVLMLYYKRHPGGRQGGRHGER